MYFNSFNILCKNCSEIYEIKKDSILSLRQKIFLNEIREFFFTLIFLIVFFSTLLILIILEDDQFKYSQIRIFLIIIFSIIIFLLIIILFIKLRDYSKKEILKFIKFENKYGEVEKIENLGILRNNFLKKLKINKFNSLKQIYSYNAENYGNISRECLDLNKLTIESDLFPLDKLKKLLNTLNQFENFNLFFLNRNIFEIYEDKIDYLIRQNLKENQINLHNSTIESLKLIEEEILIKKNRRNSDNLLNETNGLINSFEPRYANQILKNNIMIPNFINDILNKNNDQDIIQEEKKEISFLLDKENYKLPQKKVSFKEINVRYKI